MELRVRGLVLVFSPLIFLVAGCAGSIPKDALILSQTSLQERQLETRRFDGIEESKLLAGVAGVLQDLGFNLDESETKLGLVVGSKKRSAKSAGQVAGAVLLALLGGGATPVDKEQVVRASIIVRPQATNQPNNHLIRVTFQRIIWNTRNEVTKREGIVDPKIYTEFFDKLSKAVFLEAQAI